MMKWFLIMVISMGASWQLLNQSPVASNITGSTAEDTDFMDSIR